MRFSSAIACVDTVQEVQQLGEDVPLMKEVRLLNAH